MAGRTTGMPRLDAVDLKILDALQKEGRITKLALAERVGLSPTPCWERLRRLEKAGIVEGYHARLSAKALGGMATVLTEVTLRSHTQADFQRFETAVRDIPEIVSCWATGGGIDYLLRIVTRDIDAYQRLIDSMLTAGLGIDRYFTYIVTKRVKEGSALPLDRLFARPAD